MTRKQQSSPAKKGGLEEIRRRRLELEDKLREVQSEIHAIQKAFAAYKDEKVVQQNRRKLRYPTAA